MKRIFAAVLGLALLTSIVPATAASKAQNEWATTHKIVYVGLTPKDQPNFWTENETDTTTATSDGAMLAFAKETVANTIAFWKQNSRGKMKFATSKFFIGKAGTATERCDSSADVKAAMKIAGLKSVPIGTHIVVVNVYDTCGYAGLGAFGGNSVNLRSFGTTTLIHELGHNFGYYHSSAMYCKNSDFKKFNATNCSVDEYGDFRDLMGNDEWCPDTTLSATQRATIFHTPLAKSVKIGAELTLDVSNMSTDRIIYEFGYKGNWYFFEYYVPSVNRCMSFSSILYAPQIQVRMIGPAWTVAKGNSVGPILIVRSDSDLPTSVVNVDPEMLPRDLTLTGFLEGESFQLPGAPYTLTVKSTGSTSAVFTLAKN
ncbi:MAG: hypothetical protein F2602_03360 [Actinobacteria bacterium]|nr:hypothetical protein [Actinomycetota bacterium]MTA21190.1 hypothetical protein [Actinomycetota bacterium]